MFLFIIMPKRKNSPIFKSLPKVPCYEEWSDLELNEKPKIHVKLTQPINDLMDLIKLCESYDSEKTYDLDMKRLSQITKQLICLNNMIGMNSIKQDIVDHILYYIQNIDSEIDMMHTVIYGPPGTGKTEVAKLIANIYLGLGVLKKDVFIKATRSTLIGQYLGQTAPLTQKVINSAIGGVLFIDEVYSLGNSEKRDSYSKECIDTINENLTDKKTDFICIIAGYKEDVKKCFFSYNKGLERRFPITFQIDNYNGEELFQIFCKKIKDSNWLVGSEIEKEFFITNYKDFPNFGGDMEILFNRCKKSYTRRTFCSGVNNKMISREDLDNGFKIYKIHRDETNTTNKDDEMWKNMYL